MSRRSAPVTHAPGFLRLNRRWLAVAAAVISFTTLTIHDLPASAAVLNAEPVVKGSQSLKVGQAVVPSVARDDTFAVSLYTSVQWPVNPASPISSYFGHRAAPCSGCSSDHQGVDFTPGEGTPIEAIADGVVVASEFSGALGQHVVIQHIVDGKMVQSVYGHMIAGSDTVAVGQTVTRGSTIGRVGSTGDSTGPHLHFGILPDGGDAVEPLAWLAKHANEPWE